MFSHVVFFWLKPELTEVQRADFLAEVKALAAIPGVIHCHIGTPASTDRPVIDRSYSVGLNLIFPSLAAHDVYQVHPLHLAFVEKCKSQWAKVVIYDFA